MRIFIALMLSAWLAWQTASAAAQAPAGAKSSPAAGLQNPTPAVRPGIGAANSPVNPNIPPVSPRSRYRYQSGHWRYRNPSQLPSAAGGQAREEHEPPAYGQWSSNRLGAPAMSRYSLGYRPQWNPYSGYSYGYNSGFGRSLYGYGNGYQGLKPGYLGFGGNGHFSNGAFSSGN